MSRIVIKSQNYYSTSLPPCHFVTYCNFIPSSRTLGNAFRYYSVMFYVLYEIEKVSHYRIKRRIVLKPASEI